MAKKTTKKTTSVLTKEKEYAILYLHNTMKMSPKDISKELNMAFSEIETFIETIKPETINKQKRSKSHDLMITKTSAKKTNNVSIMTEAASQYNDEVKKDQQTKHKRSRDYIRIIER